MVADSSRFPSIAYTRDGALRLSAEGALVNSAGHPLQPALSIPDGAQSVTVGADGTVTVQMPGEATPVTLGTLTLTDFINPAGLQARGDNLFDETAASGPPQQGTPGINGIGSIAQGALESSNVNVRKSPT